MTDPLAARAKIMTCCTWVTIPLFALVLLAVLPFTSSRVFALRMLKRLLEGGMLLGVSSCVVFSCVPSSVPSWLQEVVEPALAQLRQDSVFEAAERLCGSAWPILATLFTGVGLIYLSHLAGLIRRTVRSSGSRRHSRSATVAGPRAVPLLLKDLIDS
jgi:hypothetical protein